MRSALPPAPPVQLATVTAAAEHIRFAVHCLRNAQLAARHCGKSLQKERARKRESHASRGTFRTGEEERDSDSADAKTPRTGVRRRLGFPELASHRALANIQAAGNSAVSLSGPGARGPKLSHRVLLFSVSLHETQRKRSCPATRLPAIRDEISSCHSPVITSRVARRHSNPRQILFRNILFRFILVRFVGYMGVRL